MALPQVISRNQTQKILGTLISARVVIQPNTWYTCPTGQKATVKGTATCTGLGASANTTLTVAGVVIRRSISGGATDPWDRDMGQNVEFDFVAYLDAGDTMITTQDTGTNAEWDITATVLESPA